MKEKVVLAYSGGLDTSVILKWLLLKGFDVVCFLADVGQEEDFEKAKEKPSKLVLRKSTLKTLKRNLLPTTSSRP